MTFAAGVVVGILSTFVVSGLTLLGALWIGRTPKQGSELTWAPPVEPADELAARRPSGGQS